MNDIADFDRAREQTGRSVSTSRKRVLMISTYRIACGIAAFTETLESHLTDRFDIEIAALDQYVLRSKAPRLVAAADRLIADISKRASNVDVVNLQWEPGLLGIIPEQMLRRFRSILKSNHNMVVTVHSVIPTQRFSPFEFWRKFRDGGVRDAGRYAYVSHSLNRYAQQTYKLLAKAAQHPGFRVIVHTPRERRFFQEAIGIPNVFDHPLSQIRKGWEERLATAASIVRQELELQYGEGRRFVGFFGFLSEYKGITTLVEAMRYLPDNFILLLFGGVHPNTIRQGDPVDPYLQRIMEAVDPTPKPDRSSRKSLVDRVRFLGTLDDFEFAASMMACDVNVLPYLEVGQSASLPVALSIELQKPTIVSNNRTFVELAKYFPKSMVFFDIGNHLQLAQTISSITGKPWPKVGLRYTSKTQADFYTDVLHGRLSNVTPRFKPASLPVP